MYLLDKMWFPDTLGKYIVEIEIRVKNIAKILGIFKDRIIIPHRSLTF